MHETEKIIKLVQEFKRIKLELRQAVHDLTTSKTTKSYSASSTPSMTPTKKPASKKGKKNRRFTAQEDRMIMGGEASVADIARTFKRPTSAIYNRKYRLLQKETDKVIEDCLVKSTNEVVGGINTPGIC